MAQGTCLTSNLSYMKEGPMSKYLYPLLTHTYLDMAEVELFLENISLAFKGTSHLGWETHVFHRHGLLWCFIKTPGMILATQDMYTSKTIP